MSTWRSIVLGNAFAGLGASSQEQRNFLNDKVSELQILLVQIQKEIGDAQTALGVTNQTVQSLLASGFYLLDLPPGDGGLITRAENAGNQPPTIGQVYSAGIIIGAQSTSAAQILQNYQALKRVIEINI